MNEATTARFDRCNGEHVASGDTVLRSFPGQDRALPICERCGCPYNQPGRYYANSRGGHG